MYRPSGPFTTTLKLLIPTIVDIRGRKEKTYPAYNDGININCLVKSYGGTYSENVVDKNGMLVVLDTMEVETWYDPRITNECKVGISASKIYNIISEPENIEQRNQFIKFKIQRKSPNV